MHPKYITTMTISGEQVNSQSANESLFNKQEAYTCTHAHKHARAQEQSNNDVLCAVFGGN